MDLNKLNLPKVENTPPTNKPVVYILSFIFNMLFLYN